MTWKALVDKQSGTLKSLGTRFADDASARFDVIELGETQPDLSVTSWDDATRTFVPIVPAVIVDRLDDVRAWVQADADYLALTGSNRTRVNNLLSRLVPRLLGPRRFRVAHEVPELEG